MKRYDFSRQIASMSLPVTMAGIVPIALASWPDFEPFKRLHEQMIAECEAAERGEKTHEAAADALFSTLESADWITPGIPFADRNIRYMTPNPLRMLRLAHWVARRAPPEVKELIVNTGIQAVKALAKGTKIF